MKKIVSIAVFMLLNMIVIAQNEKSNDKAIADRFEMNYNSDNFDAIFSEFSAEMKNFLPLDKTKDFFTNLKQQSGKILNREFKIYKNDFASYKTKFEKATFTVNISVDNASKINGIYIEPFNESRSITMSRNKTNLILPFKDEWTVIWGGDSKDLNHHINNQAQKNAFDILITDSKDNSYKTNGKTNDDYYAFGKEIIAPCDGEVVLVVEGIKDNVPGVSNPIYVPGNTVIIKTQNNEYLFFAHFKQHSIVVKQGDRVKQGQLLGLCGNSGNSSEPHLHFHIQDAEDINTATGIKCYFENIIVNEQIKNDYSPVQKDKIKTNQQ